MLERHPRPAESGKMGPTMKIFRVFNNNSVAVVLENGREAVLVGPGVGYAKKRGDELDESLVEKRFILENEAGAEGMRRLLVSLPVEIVALTARVAERLVSEHKVHMSPPVEIGLADHLATAIDRLAQGVPLYNHLLFEVKATYPSEFKMALDVLRWVEELSGHHLPVDEAGFITMHLVNAGVTGGMAETLRAADALRGVLAIVREFSPIGLSSDSMHYARFLTHVKYAIQRFADNAQFVGGHENMYAVIREDDPAAFACAERCADYLSTVYPVTASNEEVFYLALYLSRFRQAEARSAE